MYELTRHTSKTFVKSVIIYLCRYMLRKTGAVVKNITIGERTYCYAERGSQRSDHLSMVLVHGFSTSKDMWVPLLKVSCKVRYK